MPQSRSAAVQAHQRLLVVALLGLLAATSALGKPPSPQHLWKNRCSECHGHVGEFASKYLTAKEDLLEGRHHVKDLRRFMGHHYPPQGQVQAMHDYLRELALTRVPRYTESCSACHKDIEDFAKNSLELKEDGFIFAKTANKELRSYLRKHKELSRGDADFFNGVLTRSAWKVHRDEPEPDPNFEKKLEAVKAEKKKQKWSRDAWLEN